MSQKAQSALQKSLRLMCFLKKKNYFLFAQSRLAHTAPDYVDHYSKFCPSPLSVQNFLDFGYGQPCPKTSLLFLKKELPVRFANIMKELNHLPFQLKNQPSIQLIKDWYLISMEEILQFEDANPNDVHTLEKFTDTVVNIRNRHNQTVDTMAQGIMQLKHAHQVDALFEQNIQYFLNRFYLNRISIRMLITNHITLFGKSEQIPTFVGVIHPACDVRAVIEDAFQNARFLCEQSYLVSPDMEIVEHNSVAPGAPILFAYIPSHLHHMAFELFKNAMRATVEHHGTASSTYPPLKVTIVKGASDLSIKISDRGGGFPQQSTDLLFQYLYTTADTPQPSDRDSTPLAGYGYGLPLSRLYAKYFQGDLQLYGQEGLGTDALITLKAFSHENIELLPIYNHTAAKNYRLTAQSLDWTSPGYKKYSFVRNNSLGR